MTTQPEQASPRPWRHVTEDGSLGSIIDSNGRPVGQTQMRLGDNYHRERQANAALIVTAVNAHEQLLAALGKIRDEATSRFICECDHSNENCCAVVGEYCPMCIAATVLSGDR